MSYFLETSRIGFKNWSANDFTLAKSLWGNPQVTHLISSKTNFSDEEILTKLNLEIQNLKKFGVQYWPIFSLENQAFIGTCGLHPYNLFDSVFELSIQILPEYWHSGIGFEVAFAMINHAFNTLNIISLSAGPNPQDQVSLILLKKLGFRFSHNEFNSQTELNHPTYILIRDEWSNS